MNSGMRLGLGAGGVACFLVLWELIVLAVGWNNDVMASPTDIVVELFGSGLLLAQYALDTIWRVLVGIILGIIVGTALGNVMGYSSKARLMLYPLTRGLNFIPMASVALVFAVLFKGNETVSTILAAMLLAAFPVATAVMVGVSRSDPAVDELFRVWGATKRHMLWKVTVPRTLPGFLDALTIAMPMAFVGATLVEIIEPHDAGLGHLLNSGRAESDVPLTFAVLVVQGILVGVLYLIAAKLRATFANWTQVET